MKLSAFEYFVPETCEEALGALDEHGDAIGRENALSLLAARPP